MSRRKANLYKGLSGGAASGTRVDQLLLQARDPQGLVAAAAKRAEQIEALKKEWGLDSFGAQALLDNEWLTPYLQILKHNQIRIGLTAHWDKSISIKATTKGVGKHDSVIMTVTKKGSFKIHKMPSQELLINKATLIKELAEKGVTPPTTTPETPKSGGITHPDPC